MCMAQNMTVHVQMGSSIRQIPTLQISGPSKGKSTVLEHLRTAPVIWLVLRVGFDPLGYFLCGENLSKLAN